MIRNAKRIEKAIRKVWESLETHLPYTHSEHPDGQAFHQRTVLDYAEQLVNLAKLYPRKDKRERRSKLTRPASQAEGDGGLGS